MKNLLLSLLLIGNVYSQQTLNVNAPTKLTLKPYTVSTLPSLANAGTGTLTYISDGATQTDCAVGGGTYTNLCSLNVTTGVWTVVSVSVGVLNFNTTVHPVDPTGVVDSTVGIQAAIDSLPATGGALYFPNGTYKTSATLTRSDTQGIILYGGGFGSIIQPTNAISGLPIIKLTNCKLCSIRDIRLNGTDNTHQPTCAIQSDINNPTTYGATGLSVIAVKIGNDASNNIQKGICWTDSGGIDQNNDVGYIDNVIIDNTSVACFSIGHGNSEGHRFIGNTCSTGPITWQLTGGSFLSDGMVTSGTDAVMDFGTGSYFHPSFISNLFSEGQPILVRTTTQAGPGVHLTNVSFAGGSSSSYAIDFNWTSSNFSMVAARFAEGTGTKLRFSDFSTAVLFEGNQLGVSRVEYAGVFTSLGNIYTTASPTWVPGADPTKVLRIQIGDKDFNRNLIEPIITGYAGPSGEGFTIPALTTGIINATADLDFLITGNMDILTGTLRDWQQAQFWKTVLFYGSPAAGQNTTRVQFQAGSSDTGTSKILQGLLNDGSTETWNISRDGALSDKTTKVAITVVGSLGTCDGGVEGTISAVSDALAPSFLATIVSGGTVHSPVYCNGTNWVAF